MAALAVSLALIGGGAQTPTIAALPSPSRPAVIEHHAPEPIAAWVRLCEQRPDECAVDVSEPPAIDLTPQAWGTLIRINQQVNAAITARTDREHWGVDDRWDFAEDGYGDCEDYQLVKRRLLVEAGFPRRALRMTVVIDAEGAGHAVMMVRTDQGDYILDNRRNTILPWHRTGYVYVKREGDDGVAWAALGGRRSPIMTANR